MPIQPNDIANLYVFPEVNTQPVDITADPNAPIQHWCDPNATGSGTYFYMGLDPTTAAPTMYSIPAAQARRPNIPVSGQPSIGNPPQAVTQPPIDMTKYNALAAEHEKVVVTLFGEQIQSTDPAPAATSTDSPLVQQIAADVAAIRAKLNA